MKVREAIAKVAGQVAVEYDAVPRYLCRNLAHSHIYYRDARALEQYIKARLHQEDGQYVFRVENFKNPA